MGKVLYVHTVLSKTQTHQSLLSSWFINLDQRSATFFFTRPDSKYLGFEGHKVFVATT